MMNIDCADISYSITEILRIISTLTPVARARDNGNEGNEFFMSSAFGHSISKLSNPSLKCL